MHSFLCCTCSSRRRCCHCRKATVPPIDVDVTDQNIDQIVNQKKYNRWLKHTQVFETRKWFYELTLWVDLYCWLLFIGNLIGIIAAHAIPILHYLYPNKVKPWGTCQYFRETGKTGYSIGCILEFHAFNVPVMCAIIGISVYILRNWSYSRLAVFEKLIALSNVLEFGYMIYEGIICWIVFIRNDPWYQTWVIFALAILISIGVGLGVYIQMSIFKFYHYAQTYEVHYPKTEYDIVSLVKETYIDSAKIRVVGSKHSQPNSIYVDDVFATNQMMISLDHYTGIRIIEVLKDNIEEKYDDDNNIIHRAIVKGGTCLGFNRDNPLSKESNGLVYRLRARGYSLEDIGGVVCQTVGGFTSMGCAGGSIYHDYYQSIYSIRIIDGTGKIRTYLKPTYKQDPNYDHDYWGVIVSMGLMGIISEITFNLKKDYNVLGSQITWPTKTSISPKYPISWLMKECVLPNQDGDDTGTLNMFADNSTDNSLYQFIMNKKNKHKTEYFRMMLWPQVNPHLNVVWKGHRQQPHDSKTKEWKNNFGKNGIFIPVLYHELATGIKGVTEQKLLSMLYNFFDRLHVRKTQMLPKWAVNSIQFLIRKVNGCPDEQYFGASWADILPMDQQMIDKLLPMQFTELWCDVEDTSKVMNVLKEFWEKDNKGLKHTGTFGWEFYAAKAGGYSENPGGAWLRPSYARISFRIDVLWFDLMTAIPYDFYTQLWNRLIENDINFRPHWGKWFPGGNVKFPKKNSKYKKWNDYYADQYPKWKQWHELRKTLDPRNIFLSTYWAETLNIQVPNHKDPMVHNKKGSINDDGIGMKARLLSVNVQEYKSLDT